MALTLETIERLAPDQASLGAAKKLLRPSNWPTLEDNGAGLVWGECQGSGSTPYRIAVSEIDGGYKCSCPSRKFPCKHALALMWLRAGALAPFAPGTPPQWVADWLARRRGPAGAPAQQNGGEGERVSIAAVQDENAKLADPETPARAEAQRVRNREERERLIAGGLAALEQWIADQLERGLAGFDARAARDCATVAKRLVDAKAGGLANRIAELPAALFAAPEEHRPGIAAEALASTYLLAQAYTRQDALPPPLKADVRQAVGWALTRETLLADAGLLRVDERWRVLALRDEVQADRLRRLETWLQASGADRRVAVLIDFMPLAGGSGANAYTPGEVLDAELVFYPSPVPLRAQIAAHRGTTAADAPWRCDARPLGDAIAEWRHALASKPWLGMYPLCAADVEVRRAGGALYLCSADIALPLAASSHDAAAPLCDIGEIACFGLWDGRALVPLLASTPLGEWTAP